MERKGVIAPPRLDGKEVLVGPNPEVAKVKGVMFGGRKQFLTDNLGVQGFNDLVARLSPRTASYTKVPLASSWCEFESLIELDRATHDALKAKYPNVLALIGAASAELGIGKVYKSLDNSELTKFLESQALFHSQYQKFGRVRFEKMLSGGRMICSDYPVYSPIYCGSAIGFYLESILRHGGNDPTVVETKCQTLGDPSCVFEMHWK
jgi:hypothetical protein